MVIVGLVFINVKRKGEISHKETEKNLKEFIERREKQTEKQNSVWVSDSKFEGVKKNGNE